MSQAHSQHDTPEAAMRRAAQQDPYDMYLVVPRSAPLTVCSAVAAAAAAPLTCRQALAGTDRWSERFQAWLSGSYRKVTLKARPAQWEKLTLMDHAVSVVADSPVLCLPPRLRSEREPLLGKLQTLSSAEHEMPAGVSDPAEHAALLVLRADRQMSSGKLLAQAAHAGMMLADSAHAARNPDQFAEWERAGWPVCVRQAGNRAWEQLRERADCVIVRDAGLTEIASGTETVLMVAPGEQTQRALDLCAEL